MPKQNYFCFCVIIFFFALFRQRRCRRMSLKTTTKPNKIILRNQTKPTTKSTCRPIACMFVQFLPFGFSCFRRLLCLFHKMGSLVIKNRQLPANQASIWFVVFVVRNDSILPGFTNISRNFHFPLFFCFFFELLGSGATGCSCSHVVPKKKTPFAMVSFSILFLLSTENYTCKFQHMYSMYCMFEYTMCTFTQ